MKETGKMEYEIVTLNDKFVQGVEIRTENANGKGAMDIGMLWQDFLANGKQELIKNRIGQNCIGLYTDYEGDYTKPYSYLAGCEVSGENENSVFPVKKIYAGKYARFVAKGDLQQAVQEIWNAVWSLPLDRSYQSDFEDYLQGDGGQEIHIYIGIK